MEKFLFLTKVMYLCFSALVHNIFFICYAIYVPGYFTDDHEITLVRHVWWHKNKKWQGKFWVGGWGGPLAWYAWDNYSVPSLPIWNWKKKLEKIKIVSFS